MPWRWRSGGPAWRGTSRTSLCEPSQRRRVPSSSPARSSAPSEAAKPRRLATSARYARTVWAERAAFRLQVAAEALGGGEPVRPGICGVDTPLLSQESPRAVKEPDGEPRAGPARARSRWLAPSAASWGRGRDSSHAGRLPCRTASSRRRCDSARPSSPSRPRPARTESADKPATAVSFSTEVVARSGRASSRIRSSKVSPSWTAAAAGFDFGERFAAGRGKLRDLAGVGDADRSSFPEQPVAAC